MIKMINVFPKGYFSNYKDDEDSIFAGLDDDSCLNCVDVKEEVVDDDFSNITNDITDIKAVLNKLIIDEWEAIDGYDKAEQLAKNLNFDCIINVLEDIKREEQIHIGQLQKCLELYNNSVVNKINEGEIEAAEELDDLEAPYFKV